MRHFQHRLLRLLPRSWRRLALAGAVGVSIGWATAPSLYTNQSSILLPYQQQSFPDQDQIKQHRAATFGIPSSMGVRVHQDYIVAFDWRTRNPIWVAQMLRKSDQSQAAAGRNRSKTRFIVDDTVPAPFRTHSRDYIGSGLDRGHLAPSADAESQQGLEETFIMSNISPQVGDGFNRTYWNRLERFIRRLLNQYENVYIISGPLFLPEHSNSKTVQYDLIGNDIAVPTHFFKSIIAVRTGLFSRKTYSTASFIVPNRNTDPSAPLSSFKVPLEELESKAGLILWPNIDRSTLYDLCDETACVLLQLPKFHRRRGDADNK